MPVSKLFTNHISTARGVNLIIEKKPSKIWYCGENEQNPFIKGSSIKNINDFASILEFLCLNK
jgi:hypothetical protein